MRRGLRDQLEETKVQSTPEIVVKKSLKSKAKEKTDFFTRNARFFRINFEKMLAISACNKIHVMTAREFTIIDVSDNKFH
jgi:Ser-tRNA(Ala) deacylase AlaX